MLSSPRPQEPEPTQPEGTFGRSSNLCRRRGAQLRERLLDLRAQALRLKRARAQIARDRHPCLCRPFLELRVFALCQPNRYAGAFAALLQPVFALHCSLGPTLCPVSFCLRYRRRGVFWLEEACGGRDVRMDSGGQTPGADRLWPGPRMMRKRALIAQRRDVVLKIVGPGSSR